MNIAQHQEALDILKLKQTCLQFDGDFRLLWHNNNVIAEDRRVYTELIMKVARCCGRRIDVDGLLAVTQIYWANNRLKARCSVAFVTMGGVAQTLGDNSVCGYANLTR